MIFSVVITTQLITKSARQIVTHIGNYYSVGAKMFWSFQFINPIRYSDVMTSALSSPTSPQSSSSFPHALVTAQTSLILMFLSLLTPMPISFIKSRPHVSSRVWLSGLPYSFMSLDARHMQVLSKMYLNEYSSHLIIAPNDRRSELPTARFRPRAKNGSIFGHESLSKFTIIHSSECNLHVASK